MTDEGKAAFEVLLQTWKEMATAVDQLTSPTTNITEPTTEVVS